MVRFLLLLGIIISVSSFVWFLLGSTAYFQRDMDIIGSFVLWFVAIPVLLCAGLYVVLLLKGWTPENRAGYVGISVVLLLSVFLSVVLIQSVYNNGWAKEKIVSDTLKLTTDGKYEYRIDLINLFQKDSHARLYLKEMSSGEELYIPIDIQTSNIEGLGVKKFNHWILLEPTDDSSLYILSTTDELGIPIEKFSIDIHTKTSRRMN